MNRFLMNASVVVLTLAIATVAHAGKNGGGNSGNKSNTPSNYNSMKPNNYGQSNNNTQFSNTQKLSPSNTSMNFSKQNSFQKSWGTCYKGKNCNHWTHSCWWGSYGCTCYWDPCCSCYYYFCVPDNCYYPISYCPYGVYAW